MSDYLSQARELAQRYDLVDLATKLSAFYAYNDHIAWLVPLPTLLQDLAEHCAQTGSKPSTPPIVMRIALSASKGFSSDSRLLSHTEIKTESSFALGESLNEIPTMLAQTKRIFNPGTGGQMLAYVLDKFGPHDLLLARHLGFTSQEACLSVRFLHARMLRAMARIPRSRFRRADRAVVPPRSFFDAWSLGATLDEAGRRQLGAHGLSEKVVGFLTGEWKNFAESGSSFGRWAFARNARGDPVLLIPGMLCDTLVSSIHMGLLEKLSESEQGSYGRILGRRFEDLVANMFLQKWPGVHVSRGKKVPNLGDVDLAVTLPNWGAIVVQCKGRLLRPVARWGREELFLSDLRRNIIEAANQAEKSLQIMRQVNVSAVFIVLEAYFPGATFFSFGPGEVSESLQGLPHPVVLSYYDLEYLLSTVHSDALPEYLQWREAILKSRRFIVSDEFDMVRLFERRSELAIDRIIEVSESRRWDAQTQPKRPILVVIDEPAGQLPSQFREALQEGGTLIFIGEDTEFYMSSLESLDHRLELPRFRRP